jgi:hypothetical protein
MAVVFRGAPSPEYRLRERGVDLSETRNVVAAPLAEVAPRAGRHVIATIGIDRYRHWRQLGNAINDATGTAALFRQLGFEDVVRPLLDEHATRAEIEGLVTDELTRLGPDDNLVVFYAGHGGTRTQTVNGREVPASRPDEPVALRDLPSEWSIDDHVGIDAGVPSVVAAPARPRLPAVPPTRTPPHAHVAAAPSRTCDTPIKSPRGAEVLWNGTVTRVPGTLQVPCGLAVTVHVRKPRFAEQDVQAVGGRPIEVSLEKQRTDVLIKSIPPRAAINVSGRAAGFAPVVVRIPEFESSMVTATLDGHDTATRKVTPAEAGDVVTIELTPTH